MMDEILLAALDTPGLQKEDAVKLVFQAMLGCGHLLGTPEAVTGYIIRELAQAGDRPGEPLYEDISRDYVRLNLRLARAAGLKPEWIERLMRLSGHPVGTRQDVARTLTELGEQGIIPAPDDQQLRQVLAPDWLPSHSEAWREAHAPCYRVIRRGLTPLLPVLSALAALLPGRERVMISIDGPCGSGKTTLAAQLAYVLGTQVVHTDDFVVPHSRKTPERLAIPGGNEDHERLAAELRPWRDTGTAVIRPYACMRDMLLPEKEITGGILLL